MKSKVWVVVGGQYGSEGKGKVASQIIKNEGIYCSVRCGGPNSGHSVTIDGKKIILRQLSVGALTSNCKRLLIPAGGIIDLKILYDEINLLGIDPKRIGVDQNAFILSLNDLVVEETLELGQAISSTQSGTGAATARRVMRRDTTTASSVKETWFSSLVTNVSEEVNSLVDSGESVLIEGTQGLGLSLYHSPYYPKATSRDTSAAGMISEVGISPKLVDEIVVVFRTFPIRVSGANAGPLEHETYWRAVQQESGYPHDITEYTSVTRKPRRVGQFDYPAARRAIKINRPTKVAMMGLDYVEYEDKGKTSFQNLSGKSRDFIGEFRFKTESNVHYVGTGPGLEEFFEI